MMGLGRLAMYRERLKFLVVHRSDAKAHPEEYLTYSRIIREFRESGGLKNRFQEYKLHALGKILAERKPRRILELGSGSSTALFADYVRANGAHLTSVDESAEWIANSARIARIAPGEKGFEFKAAPRKVAESPAGIEFRYEASLGGDYDLVLVDGPSMSHQGRRRKDGVCGNVFDVAAARLPDTILVDGRRATVDALVERLGDRYEAAVSDIIREDIRTGYNYFSVFRRKRPGA